jgi:cold shock CspA family protein
MRVQAKLKWFNRKDGFGFLTAPDMADIYMHAMILKRDGVFPLIAQQPPPECTVVAEVVSGNRGLYVTKVISVTAQP